MSTTAALCQSQLLPHRPSRRDRVQFCATNFSKPRLPRAVDVAVQVVEAVVVQAHAADAAKMHSSAAVVVVVVAVVVSDVVVVVVAVAAVEHNCAHSLGLNPVAYLAIVAIPPKKAASGVVVVEAQSPMNPGSNPRAWRAHAAVAVVD